MKIVKWSQESLIARSGGSQAAVADMVVAAERGEQVKVQIERAESYRILGRLDRVKASRGSLRQGCIKIVEACIWPLPQRGRVLAEIHRRLDRLPESDCSPTVWRSGLASIYDFACAWALAAQLMRAGLQVSVVEGEGASMLSSNDDGRGNVEIIIPIGLTQGA